MDTLTLIASNAAVAASKAISSPEMPRWATPIKSAVRQPMVFGVDIEEGDDGSGAGFRLGCEMHRYSASDFTDTDPFHPIPEYDEAKAKRGDVIVVAVRRPRTISVEFRAIGMKEAGCNGQS